MKSMIGVLFVLAGSSAWAESTCDQLKGLKFVSINDQIMGETPDGPVFGKWTIEFNKDKAELVAREHDYFVRGAYDCENREGRIVLDREPAGKWVGYYQPGANLLLFEGKWYRLFE